MPYATNPPERLIVLDIETTPDRERLPDSQAGRFPKPIYHRVACISLVEAEITRDPDGYEHYAITACRTGGEDGWDERRLLEGFWRFLAGRPARIAGWNTRSFDSVVLLQRSLIHRVSAEPWFSAVGLRDRYRYRYDDEWHADVMDLLGEHGASSTKLSLDETAACCGLPGKMVAHGSRVETLIAEGRLDAVRDYCEVDCLNTYGLYLRYALLTGRTSQTGHNEAIADLVRHLDERRAGRPHFGEFLDLWQKTAATPGDMTFDAAPAIEPRSSCTVAEVAT